MDDLIEDVAARLVAVLEEFGDDAFREAALKAAVAIARVALSEAENRATHLSFPTGVVLPFRRGEHECPAPDGESDVKRNRKVKTKVDDDDED